MKKIIVLIIFLSVISDFSAQLKTEEITIHNKKIELPGTLSFYEEKTPLIIWVHGSGNIDRNGNQPKTPVKANYIQQFRSAVNKKNIAFFSFDKRSANPKNKDFLKETKITDFAKDIDEVILYFQKDNRFSKIFLVGHSQGSLIAMLTKEKTAGFVSIAGTGETIDKTIVKQLNKNNSTLAEAAKKQFDTLKVKGKIAVVNLFLTSIFAKQIQAFLYSWMQYNPAKEIKKIKTPILIVQGDKELQVKIEDANLLKKAKPSSKLVIIKNMNHVLKEINSDSENMSSYYSDKFPISEKLIEVVVQFIKK
ncbi:alpha/beta hydrolase family protein [Polaribacter tangerinus]|uniref:alpha/beta hydrolase family protein n=1 Tax=Polaribacter tangerinus TaxID=1920034 RepID=UPI000B4B808B|nr:alpha/beta hydrolase [Polaribacter tangerinus]